MGKARVRRRAPKIDTERADAIVACARHLRDLRRGRRAPPADIALPGVSVPERLTPAPTHSGCASPAQLCAELAEEPRRRAL